ncbi:ACT domain-containing protein [Cryobacterium psychrophilum]|nr:ACT domain-containing protein [Cryobacterium psychrophilum]
MATAELRCDDCGQLPEASKTRQTVANVVTILPIELLVHAAVVRTELPYVAKVLVLALTATTLVIWVAEPGTRRLLRRWLHAPALRRRSTLHASPALWRVRTILPDESGTLERVTHGFSRLDVNILSIHVHPVDGGVLDEFVVSAPGELSDDDILASIMASGGRATRVWPTTPLALTDGQTKALGLAARVAGDPGELAQATAELLSARIVTVPAGPVDDTLLKIPRAWNEPLYFSRPGDPFTPAEASRAYHLAELAEVVELTGRAHPDAAR